MVLSDSLHRRRALIGLGASIVLAGLGLPLYMSRIEPAWLRLRRIVVPLGRAGPVPPLRLLHLSDLHRSADVPLEFIRRAILLGLAGEPDLACVTGDFITSGLPDPAGYAAVLRELSERVPTFACLGNHDGGRWAGRHGGTLTTGEMRAFLEGARIRCLFNESVSLRLREVPITLVGVGDLWAGDTDPASAFHDVAENAGLRLVLCHNPDTKERLADYRWDLLLCGHTHGGQLRLPLLGTPFAPVRDHRYVVGLHEWAGRRLHVTAGVGNLYGLRLNCRPEVSLLALGGPEPALA